MHAACSVIKLYHGTPAVMLEYCMCALASMYVVVTAEVCVAAAELLVVHTATPQNINQ
jgi:hypothetical protein